MEAVNWKKNADDVMPETEILRVEQLSKRFFVHERQQHLVAFEGVCFVAGVGQLVGLVGASGSGKSSILKCIYRSYLTTSGRILYRNRRGAIVDLAEADGAIVLGLRRTEIRCVSQFLRVMPRKSALQVIERTLLEYSIDSTQNMTNIQDKAASCLQRVGLPSNLWKLPPQTFSGGEKQLVNLAQALAVKPRLLLLDEPTASLTHPRDWSVRSTTIVRMLAPTNASIVATRSRSNMRCRQFLASSQMVVAT